MLRTADKRGMIVCLLLLVGISGPPATAEEVRKESDKVDLLIQSLVPKQKGSKREASDNHKPAGTEAGQVVHSTVFFAHNSDQILGKAIPVLTTLAGALGADELKGHSFLVMGHTDARGGERHNLELSRRRAEAVRSFLVEKSKIDPGQLVAIGLGFQQLKNRARPLAGENRRVEIVNVAPLEGVLRLRR